MKRIKSILAIISITFIFTIGCGFEEPLAPCANGDINIDGKCKPCCLEGGVGPWGLINVTANPYKQFKTKVELMTISAKGEEGVFKNSPATFPVSRTRVCGEEKKVIIRAVPAIKSQDHWYGCSPSKYSLDELTVTLKVKGVTKILQGIKNGKMIRLPRYKDNSFCAGEAASLPIPATKFPNCPDCRIK